MSKQISAVEWLYDQLEFDDSISMDDIEKIFEQANNIFENQIINAYAKGQETPYEYSEDNEVNWYNGNKYYNETFKSE